MPRVDRGELGDPTDCKDYRLFDAVSFRVKRRLEVIYLGPDHESVHWSFDALRRRRLACSGAAAADVRLGRPGPSVSRRQPALCAVRRLRVRRLSPVSRRRSPRPWRRKHRHSSCSFVFQDVAAAVPCELPRSANDENRAVRLVFVNAVHIAYNAVPVATDGCSRI